MAATNTAAAKAAEKDRGALSLQQKFVELRKAIPGITQKKYSDGVKYKFAKIFDVYELLTPAMNEWGVNFDIKAEEATHHDDNGDGIFYQTFQQQTQRGTRLVWIYEADLTVCWTNADRPEEKEEVTLHAIGTNDGGPDKAKGSAWTYCLKYYLFEKFGIDQGDEDPDMADHGSETPAQAPAQNGRQNAQESRQDNRGRNTQGQSQTAQSGRQSAGRGLSDAQLGRMYRKGEDAGWTREQLDAQIGRKYGLQDPHGLTRAQYDDICNQLDASKKQNGGQGNV